MTSFFLSLVGWFLLLSLPALAQETSNEFAFPVSLPIQCHGDTEYLADEAALTVRSRDGEPANVIYGERSITAEEIVVDFESQLIRAHGNVRMWDNGRVMIADEVLYDLNKEEARLYNVKQAHLTSELYLTGDEIVRQRVSGGIPKGATQPEQVDQYTVRNGTVTTCDLPIPHYYIHYDKMTIIPDDRFWLHDVWWLQGGFPLGYLPFFTRSLAKHRITYIFYPGYSNRLGVATYHKLNVHLDPRLRFSFYGDTFSKVGYGYGGLWKFRFPGQYAPEGKIRWYGVNQHAPDDDNYFEDELRSRLSGQYRQTLPHDITVRSRFHQSSDFEFNEDYDRVMEQKGVTSGELERDIPSYISVSKSWDRQTVRISATKRLEDFFYSQLPGTERLPQARWDLMPSSIGDTKLVLNAHVAYDDARREQGYHLPRSKKERTKYIDEVERTDAEVRLSYPLDLPYQWVLSPHLGYRGTDYSNPTRRTAVLANQEFGDEFRSMLEGGTELSTRSVVYWDAGDRWGKLRWVFEPILGYDYYDPDVDLEKIGLDIHPGQRFPYIDSVDEYRATFHRVSAQLKTKLQRRNSGGVRTLAYLTMGSAYDYFPDDNLRFDNLFYTNDRADSSDHRYTDYFEEFRISPISWLSLGNYLRYDLDDSALRASNTYLQMSPASRWFASIGYNSFDDPFISSEEQEEVYWGARCRLSKKWTLSFSQRYDVDESNMRRNRISFIRNLHDFQAILEFEQRNRLYRDDEYSFLFMLQFLGFGGKYSVF